VYKQFDWARLNNELAPADIKLALNVFNDMRVPVGEIDIDNFDMESPQLERELEFINSIVAEIRKENMNIESTVDRWDLVFQRAEKQGFPLDTLTPIVCNILVLSPSNAANESMFSLLNY